MSEIYSDFWIYIGVKPVHMSLVDVHFRFVRRRFVFRLGAYLIVNIQESYFQFIPLVDM